MALINCPECNTGISDTVKKCPHCGYKIKKSGGCLNWIVAIGAVLAIFYFMGTCGGNSTSRMRNSSTNTKSDNRDYGEERLAYNISKDYVLENLKSPKSAEFPGLFESKNHVKYLGKNRYQINSWVDSQNGFGANIRTKFSCIMVKKSENEWGIEDLRFE